MSDEAAVARAPGAGKGTQGARLADRLGVQHVSAGELRRAEAYQRRGDLVPDAIVFDVLTPVVVAAVCLDAPEAVLVRRLLDRAAQEGRGDDTAAVIRHRLDVYATATSPLIAYYRDRGILLEVDADQPPEVVTTEILTRLSDRSPIRDTT